MPEATWANPVKVRTPTTLRMPLFETSALQALLQTKVPPVSSVQKHVRIKRTA